MVAEGDGGELEKGTEVEGLTILEKPEWGKGRSTEIVLLVSGQVQF